MITLTLKELAGFCGGRITGTDNPEGIAIHAITTDSREAKSGCLFAAVKGEKTDGHNYMEKARENGAEAVLCSRVPERADIPAVVVADTLTALQQTAKALRAKAGIPVVGIGGSVGKTSTKEMTAAVLSVKYNLLKTEGNFNNELGVPLTLFRLEKEHELAVLEMGISDFGEMHVLADIVRPDVCILTNIGDCHLEFLGDREGVLKAKSEMFDFLTDKGRVILNGDDALLGKIADVHGIRPVFYGLSPEEDVWADEIEAAGLAGSSCRIHAGGESVKVFVPAPGEHMIYNALAGVAAGLVLGMTLQETAEGIGNYAGISGRFRTVETGRLTIIDDCYNANPMSMKASLTSLASAQGKRAAILGDMAELGEKEKAFHEEVGAFAAGLPLSLLCCVGRRSEAMAEAAKAAAAFPVKYFPDREALLAALPGLFAGGETILVKASHSMEFPEVVAALEKL